MRNTNIKFFGVALTLIALLLLVGCLGQPTGSPTPKETPTVKKELLEGKKVVFIVSHEGFRDEELKIPMEMIKEKGADVSIASDGKGKAKGALGMEVNIDFDLNEVKVDEYDAIVFIGGPGTPKHLWGNHEAISIVKEAYGKGKIIAAICLAPGVLAEAGVLKGRDATIFHTAKNKLVSCGANYKGERVVVSDKIITASGPEAAKEFGEAIINVLTT